MSDFDYPDMVKESVTAALQDAKLPFHALAVGFENMEHGSLTGKVSINIFF